MKHSGFIALALVMLCANVAFAQQPAPVGAAAVANPIRTPTICLMGKTTAVDGLKFQTCDASPENNALLVRGFTMARLDRGTIKSKQPIWAHDICKFVDNRSNNRDVLVPFDTPENWQAFIKLAPDIMNVAGCCVPRRLAVEDIPEPTIPCLGKWALRTVFAADSFVSPQAGAEKIPNEKMRISSDGVLMDTNNNDIQLPLVRDDDNVKFSLDNTQEFAAQWQCGGDPTEDSVKTETIKNGVVATTVTAKESAEKEGPEKEGAARDMDTLYVTFHMGCTRENWVPMAAEVLCVPSDGNKSLPCDQFGFPPETKGEVLVQERVTCPGGITTRDIVKDTCEGELVKTAPKTPAPAAGTPAVQ
jgi:hypothetical protein